MIDMQSRRNHRQHKTSGTRTSTGARFCAAAVMAASAMTVPAWASPAVANAHNIGGGGNAADTVQHLQGHGYSVQLNGIADAPLSQCVATDVTGIPSDETVFTTVYVTVSCRAHTS
ncbi:hypothetical protein CCUG60885_03206 [Mycobacteroides salmoniphilum]|uniref:PASTA domain-containing protein n=2 Tax=Mycobacteroides salmoniphilum TaxID=404941 RepID=A0A4R8SDS8_9MYCO|nr:hypothetical protein CCUG60885_03206 [Mycobacteroides salmoniphilum]TEA09386.1 hypothetical protein CCUG60883_00147 [Mycobacteroides salmoniphilum]